MTLHTTTREVPATAGASGPCPAACNRCPCQPSTYSLTAAELRAEIRRCHAAGWQLWEITYRFGHPRAWKSTVTSPKTIRKEVIAR